MYFLSWVFAVDAGDSGIDRPDLVIVINDAGVLEEVTGGVYEIADIRDAPVSEVIVHCKFNRIGELPVTVMDEEPAGASFGADCEFMEISICLIWQNQVPIFNHDRIIFLAWWSAWEDDG